MEPAIPSPETHFSIDPQVCRTARQARDPRFDGLFFVGVRTTGIYCRPVCPARSPAEKNVSYYPSAAQAAANGYRPCLRCRPESAPRSPAWVGTSTTLQRSLQLIEQGALNHGSVAQLAARLGIGERYLRKLFHRELGLSPQQVAINQRLLFAKKLLAETRLSLTDVAFAAGFGSVRRFNSAVKEHFKLTPGALRRHSPEPSAGEPLRMELQFRPPYDWRGVLAFFRRHAIEGIEQVSDKAYLRNLPAGSGATEMRVRKVVGRNALRLELTQVELPKLMSLVARVRRMFDLDANPAMIEAILSQDMILAPLIESWPGIRAPGYFSLYEAGVRAIVGQQVSTAAARSVCGRLAAACADGGKAAEFPPPASLAMLQDTHFPMPGRRRDTLRALARTCTDDENSLNLESLATFSGVGPWTLAMVGMRGAGDPDAFPLTDLGVVQAWQAISDGATLESHAAHWRPWRAYAANLLWRSLSP